MSAPGAMLRSTATPRRYDVLVNNPGSSAVQGLVRLTCLALRAEEKPNIPGALKGNKKPFKVILMNSAASEGLQNMK